MEEKIIKMIKMIVYYILALCPEEKKTIKSCIELNKILVDIAKKDKSELDKFIGVWPENHPVPKLYREIKEEELITLLEISQNKFENCKIENDYLKNIEDDNQAEELIKKIAK